MDRRVHRIFTGFLYCVFWFHRLCFCFLYISSYFTFSANHQEAGFFWFCFANWKHNKTHTHSRTHIHPYIRTIEPKFDIWGVTKTITTTKRRKIKLTEVRKNLLQLFGRQLINAVDNVLTGTKGYHHTFGCWRVSFIKSC